ncbi:unnamed protein product [Lactuca saligna]|uniref:PB1-like domain-containing protein n=1 Tax=Lactuca saligna TaxID=75948 RepID=A0AA35Z8D5_LACSI|nr:unnamed protein product [Lactuca saligna]
MHHGGEFTSFPGRKYICGKQTFVDLLDIDTFSVHDIDKMIEDLGYTSVGKPLYYHFQRPFGDLDFGLFALASKGDYNTPAVDLENDMDHMEKESGNDPIPTDHMEKDLGNDATLTDHMENDLVLRSNPRDYTVRILMVFSSLII